MDVSTYEPVVWAEVPAEQCDTAFVKQCEDREEEVCADVTETRCQVSPHIRLDIRVTASILHTVGVIRNETLVFVNFSAQDASMLKISVPIIKRRS